jgi:hypothetical protein
MIAFVVALVVATVPGFRAGVYCIDYLLPAVLVTTGSQAAVWSGAGLATDLKNGALARFQTLSLSMTSALVARSLFGLVRNAIQLIVITVAAAMLFGYGPGRRDPRDHACVADRAGRRRGTGLGVHCAGQLGAQHRR